MICQCGNTDACMICRNNSTIAPVGIAAIGTCANLGGETGEEVECESCGGNVRIKLYECSVYGQCTLAKPVNQIPCCSGVRGSGGSVVHCPKFTPKPIQRFHYNVSEPSSGLAWSYGVTTCKERLSTTLPITLRSLERAGFLKPRLFVDGAYPSDLRGCEPTVSLCPLVTRYPRVRTTANWLLTAWELYLRDPHADRYAVFQDDFVTYRNLRQYLEACPYPEWGYLNLYTFPVNQRRVFHDGGRGWREAALLRKKPPVFYHGKEIQAGKGAVALVFSNAAMEALLTSPHLFSKPKDRTTGHCKVDGGIVTAMNMAGWREYIHNPSLVQHVGHTSSMGNNDPRTGKCAHPQAISFLGEDFDATRLLG